MMMRVLLAFLLLTARPASGDLVLLDAPADICRSAACVLLTGRYAAFHTIAADSARADIVARVVLVEQPASDAGGCPAYDPAAVRGSLVLELEVDKEACSVGTRVTLAAAAGAVGWLTVDDYPPLAVVVPGYYTYQLGSDGDRALLVDAPPAVDIGQTGAGLAGLDWLVETTTAGAAPRVSLRVREHDAYLASRLSGWAGLCRAFIGLFSLAVIEQAACRIYALVALARRSKAPVGDAPRRDARTSSSSADALGRVFRPWGIGLIVLALAASSAAIQIVSVVIDPMYAYGIVGNTPDLFLYNTPIVLAIASQSVHLVYIHESITRSGIETLMLVGGRHKALAVALIALFVLAEVALLAVTSLSEEAFDIAFAIVGPGLLACICAFLSMRVRHSASLSASASASVAAKLRRFSLGNALILSTGLAWLWLYNPASDLVLLVAMTNGFNWILYMQCELVKPVGVRTLRGPLRLAFELARAALRRSRRAALRRARGRLLSQPERASSHAAAEARLDWLASSQRAPERAESEILATGQDGSARPVGVSAAAATANCEMHAGVSLARSAAPRTDDLADHLGLGVSLACLRDFAREHGVLPSATTVELVHIIQQLTAVSRRSFAEQLAGGDASDGYPAVSRACVFVSHAQACNFTKLLSALELYQTLQKLGTGEAYFWLDLMCIRQHEVAADVLHISDVISAIGRVAMVLDPWDKPICLERVWCLYEIAQTVGDAPRALVSRRKLRSVSRFSQSGSNPKATTSKVAPEADAYASPLVPPAAGSLFSRLCSLSKVWGRELELEEGQRPRLQLFLTMSPDERLKLVQAARSSQSQIEHALTRFDCRTAKASVEADRQMILQYIAAKFAPPAGDDAYADDDVDATHVAAYQNFNRSVQAVIREAVAALSHIRTDDPAADHRDS